MRLTRAIAMTTTLASLALLPLIGGCKKQNDEAANSIAPPAVETAPAPTSEVTEVTVSAGATAPEELTITEIAQGSGPAITAGSTATVHYTGWLWDASAAEHKGAKFDSSRDGGKPFSFKLGQGDVIDGWDKGIVGMQVGDRNLLIIPPALAYKEKGTGAGLIPPNATLIFDVELLGIK